MTPILIVKTRSGFAVVEFPADTLDKLPSFDLPSLRCYGDLNDSYNYRNDGLLSAVREHFTQTESPEVVGDAVLKAA